MVWWWIGNIVFLFVIIPVVLLLLNRLWRVTAEIKQYGDDALEHGQYLVAGMDGVEHLLTTRDRVKSVRSGVVRYADALDRLV